MQTVRPTSRRRPKRLKFFAWGYKNGKQMAADLDYVPMPDNVVALIEKTWKEQDQRLRRQAGLLRIDAVREKAPRPGAFSFSTVAGNSGLCGDR